MLDRLSSKKRDGRRSPLAKGGFVTSITSAAIASGIVRLILTRLRMATNPTTKTTQIINQNSLSIGLASLRAHQSEFKRFLTVNSTWSFETRCQSSITGMVPFIEP